MSTIFISHSSIDNALVIELADRLKKWGYHSLFLDFDADNGIDPGVRWETVIYRELLSCSVVLAIITENWINSKWCFAEATHARANGKVILALRTSSIPQPAILADVQAIDYSLNNRNEALQSLKASLNYAIDPQGLGSWGGTRPPFPGLLAFDEGDSPIFFGRRKVAQIIYQKLRELIARPDNIDRFLLIFGPSGSGKSSLVRAGVIPYLRLNPEQWIVYGPVRPSQGWPASIATVFSESAELGMDRPEQDIKKLREIFQTEETAHSKTIVLVVDQLEEAISTNETHSSPFLEQLFIMQRALEGSVAVLATLRSDFMAEFQRANNGKPFSFIPFPIPSMSTDDLREVIEGPARVAGIDVPRELVDRLVLDTGNGKALPLLALALNRLWLLYTDRAGAFSLDKYEGTLGGMQGLINREAEIALAKAGSNPTIILDALIPMTRILRDGVFRKTSVLWLQLMPEVQAALSELLEARLLVKSGSDGVFNDVNRLDYDAKIEPAHEALFTGWERLRNWLGQPDTHDLLVWREELNPRADRWYRSESKAELLLGGSDLKYALRLLNLRPHAFLIHERAFIIASRDQNKSSKIKQISSIAMAIIGFISAAIFIKSLIWPNGYDLKTDFSIHSPQRGQWRYGHMAGKSEPLRDSFSELNYSTPEIVNHDYEKPIGAEGWIHVPEGERLAHYSDSLQIAKWKIVENQDVKGLEQGDITMHPSSPFENWYGVDPSSITPFIAIRWVSPSGGNYTIQGSYAGKGAQGDVCDSHGKDPNVVCNTDIWVYVGKRQILHYTISDKNISREFTFRGELEPGDDVDLIVGPGSGDRWGDTVKVSMQITKEGIFDSIPDLSKLSIISPKN